MTEVAVILAESIESAHGEAIVRLLRFFGVPSRVLSVAAFLEAACAGPSGSPKLRLFASASTFLHLLESSERKNGGIPSWRENVHSAFVYAGITPNAAQTLANQISGEGRTPLIHIDRTAAEWVIAEEHPEFCGSMSGLRLPVRGPLGGTSLALEDTEGAAHAGHDTVLARFHLQTVPVFLSAGPEVIDIGAELTSRNFDIRDHFLSAAPIVMYVKWALGEMCWQTAEIPACLIIDDPLLRPRYGFLNFEDLLEQMRRHNFSTSIAFIPWNWRRSTPQVVELFKNNPERYSLAIHGCDHTRAEFGTQEVTRLSCKAREALDRMAGHESRTGIRHDRVIVFPQGIFSGAALAVLKHAQFAAAVNTEVLSSDPAPPRLSISDVWDVAVMNYASFPIFTRRYPTQGVENFAFDILLGKPCLVVVHHDFCGDHCAPLAEFIQRLNALRGTLVWRGLGEVVRRSYRQRELAPGSTEIEMYASELRVENRSRQQKQFLITKRESEASAVQEIRAGERQLPWDCSDGRIRFELKMAPGQSSLVSIVYGALPQGAPCREALASRFKIMARRYLSEVRDNYVVTGRSKLPWTEQ